LQEAFPLQMNDFDRFLELGLAQMLDEVVKAPAPPRASPPGRHPVLRLFTAPGSLIGPVASVVVLVDAPVERRSEPRPAPAIVS